MTIEFNCPKCNELIAFADEHAGKNAHCAKCKQRFIIPSKSFEKAQIIVPPEEISAPVEGFYRAVFIDNWKLFIKPQNAAGLVFVIAAVCFKFFTGHVDYSFEMGNFRTPGYIGQVVTLLCWGCLFWYYMEMIRETALDYDELPDVYMGGLFGFIWNTAKSLYIFSMVFFAVEIPAIISFHIFGGYNFLFVILSITGFCFFPVGILTISVVGDITSILQPVNILKPVKKAFWPYFTVAILFVLTCQLELMNVEYGKLIGSSRFVIGLNLLANIAIQMLAVFTMRSIGLFYRHYGCYFKW